MYAVLVARLLAMMLLFSLCRFIFYVMNIGFFNNMTLSRYALIEFGGLRFDLTGILYLNSLFILLSILPFHFVYHRIYQNVLRWIFYITNGIGLAANMIDCVYYPFTLRRTTLTIFDQFENEHNKGTFLFRFLLDYWYAVLIWVVLIFVMTLLYKRIKMAGPQLKNKYVFFFAGLAMIYPLLYLSVVGIRGGFAHSTRPITLSNAAAYATDPKDVNIVLNTPFAFLRTLQVKVIKRMDYFKTDAELNAVYTPLHPAGIKDSMDKKNVVIFILESFSKEFFGYYNKDLDDGKYKGYTPFLDSLLGQSLAFKYSLANGRKSIDAMPSVLCGIPSIEVPYVLSQYSNDKVQGLANVLRQSGYYTAFFHGAPNGSMGFQAFAKTTGFNDYYGMTEYGNDDDFDGLWGIWDEPFLQYYADKQSSFKQPFFTTLFTVSSHHPYVLPAQYEDTFKGGKLEIYRTIQYTDYALRKYFEKVSKMPWFKNTLFVFTADHASAQIHFDKFNTSSGFFDIPVFYYEPGNDWHEYRQESCQQTDIMPSILSYLHYDKPFLAFGRNVFDKTSIPFAFNYLNNNYQYFEGKYMLFFNGEKSVALYDYQNDIYQKNNLLDLEKEVVANMEKKVKAFVQQYNNRLIDDNLTPEGPQAPVSNQ